jgi:hypothetical protein
MSDVPQTKTPCSIQVRNVGQYRLDVDHSFGPRAERIVH